MKELVLKCGVKGVTLGFIFGMALIMGGVGNKAMAQCTTMAFDNPTTCTFDRVVLTIRCGTDFYVYELLNVGPGANTLIFNGAISMGTPPACGAFSSCSIVELQVDDTSPLGCPSTPCTSPVTWSQTKQIDSGGGPGPSFSPTFGSGSCTTSCGCATFYAWFDLTSGTINTSL